jgi:hypothetical protein
MRLMEKNQREAATDYTRTLKKMLGAPSSSFLSLPLVTTERRETAMLAKGRVEASIVAVEAKKENFMVTCDERF